MRWLNVSKNRGAVCVKCRQFDDWDKLIAPALEWKEEPNGDQTRRCPYCGLNHGTWSKET